MRTGSNRFLTHVGFDKSNLPAIAQVYVGYSPKMIILDMAMKRAATFLGDRRRFGKAFRDLPETSAPSKFIFGREAAAIAERHFSADRQYLSEEFGVQIIPPDIESAENALRISAAELSEIAARAAALGEPGQKILEFVGRYVQPPIEDVH